MDELSLLFTQKCHRDGCYQSLKPFANMLLISETLWQSNMSKKGTMAELHGWTFQQVCIVFVVCPNGGLWDQQLQHGKSSVGAGLGPVSESAVVIGDTGKQSADEGLDFSKKVLTISSREALED